MWTYDAYGVTFVSDCTNNYKIASDYGKIDGKVYLKRYKYNTYLNVL